jgi:hypothetical protein
MKNQDKAKEIKISISVSNIIMLQKYARNDEHQPVPEKKILKT